MKLQEFREGRGWTQVELAERAGVSRQLVGAVESGRNLPRVDSAIALANALGVDVAALFATEGTSVDVVDGSPPEDGQLVRTATVGDYTVTTPCRPGRDGFDVVDAVVADGRLDHLRKPGNGFVVVGCEPGLELLERLLRERDIGAISVQSSTERALAALDAGRAHAAVVHGPEGSLDSRVGSRAVNRVQLASWRVGLSGGPDASPDWAERALNGMLPVIQRESGAGSQKAFESAMTSSGRAPGPLAGGHLEAAFRSVWSGMPAVTIEPAAIAAGARFYPLETHQSQLWIAGSLISEPGVSAALETLVGRRFQRRLASAGGYDLSVFGMKAA